MLDKVRAVWVLLPAALGDAGSSLRSHWWYVLLMLSFDATITTIMLSVGDLHREGLASGSAASIAGVVGGFVMALALGGFWLLLYVRAIRLSKSGYRLTPSLVGRLFLFYIMLALIAMLFGIPGYLVEFGARQIALGAFLVTLGSLFASIRFGFTLFALEFDPHPFRLSWRISGGPAFVGVASAYVAQTIIVWSVIYLMGPAPLRIALAFPNARGVIFGEVVSVIVTTFVVLLMLTVMVPWMMRVMLAFAEFPPAANEQIGA